ncbi:MAG: heme-binding protein [Gammaproteobacteria bacterium]|nr:heme-binding protein [Gammaproteobacteria bacterium]
MSISLSQAETVVEGALAKAHELGLPPVSVAVLDSGGHLKAMQRQDGVAFLRAAVCEAKAWGALALGASSRRFAERYAADALQRGFMNAMGGRTRERIVPLPGGVLIRDGGGRLLGAVGVAGAASQDDEACAIAGIEACGLVADLDSER